MRFLLLGSFAESLLNFRGPLIDALIARGVEVHVVAPGLLEGGPMERALHARGAIAHELSLQRTGMNPLSDLAALLALRRLVGQIKPDVIMAYTVKPVIYGILAAWIARVPRRYALITGLGYTFQPHGDSLRGKFASWITHRLYGLALRGVHKVFFQNPDDEALFRHLGILLPRVPSIVVRGSGVDIQHFSYQPLPQGQPVFLMVARLLGAKGVREYAAAAARLRVDMPEVCCRLVGWIDQGPDSIRQAELDEWVASGALEYLGRLDDVRSALRECSVYVLPSYREGTPRTVLEAMATGRAIITTDSPGCRETVVDGENGYLVPIRCVDQLAAAMRRIVREPGQLERMGKLSRLRAEEKYDVCKVNALMLHEMGFESEGLGPKLEEGAG